MFIRNETYRVETISGQIWGGLDLLPVGGENRADERLSVLHTGVGESKNFFLGVSCQGTSVPSTQCRLRFSKPSVKGPTKHNGSSRFKPTRQL